MNYPETFDEYPLHVNVQAIRETVAKYGEDEAVATVAIAIAGYANSKGVAFPSLDLIGGEIGFTIQEVSSYAHRGAAIGMFAICKAKAKGAKYAHNVYRFAKNFIRKTADIRSSHFIANVKKWRAEGRDVAQAIKKKARRSLDALTAEAEKMAQLFQQKPELMDDQEQSAELAGVAENTAAPDVSDAMPQPVHTEPVRWENGATWADASTEPMLKPTTAPTATIAALFGTPQPVDAEPGEAEPTRPRVYASWRDRVPAEYKEKAAV